MDLGNHCSLYSAAQKIHLQPEKILINGQVNQKINWEPIYCARTMADRREINIWVLKYSDTQQTESSIAGKKNAYLVQK